VSRPNLARRDFSSKAKREAVKQYLLEHYDGEHTYREIADDLGVGKSTVNDARQELEQAGKLSEHGQFSTSDKWEMVRSYVESHPDASNREVADAVECDLSHETVGNWRNEWEGEPTEEDRDQDSNHNLDPDDRGANYLTARITRDHLEIKLTRVNLMRGVLVHTGTHLAD